VRAERTICVLSSIVALGACGGGGSDSPPAPPPPSNPNAYPSALPNAGDWFVYTSTVTPTVPAGSAATERTITRHFRIVNADTSLTRADTVSTFNSLASRAFNASGALVTYTSGTLLCNYAPAYRSGPPSASVVGETYSTSSSESCATQPNGSPTVRTLSVTGTNQPTESKTIPLGTFNTFKYSQTLVSTSTTSVTTTLETCWIDRNMGRTVECTSNYSTVPVGQTAPTAAGSTLFRLEGYSFRGQPPVGAAARRFAGYWNVTFTGTTIGDCANLLIDINGQISGTCRFLTSVGTYGPSFAVSGSVGANGAASLSATTGASMSGTFASPENASGTWTNTGASGNWTAVHI
jgi:hypothetical protein